MHSPLGIGCQNELANLRDDVVSPDLMQVAEQDGHSVCGQIGDPRRSRSRGCSAAWRLGGQAPAGGGTVDQVVGARPAPERAQFNAENWQQHIKSGSRLATARAS